ncbi:hypothetical protein, partial [Mycobacterium paragordonae]|uniref:hypothetical protein n=2 Tax=Mycobacterium TaxID=1763 RepID=UPI003986FEE1
RPQGGVLSEWRLSVSGYSLPSCPDEDLNGDLDLLPPHGLVEVESTIRLWEQDYADGSNARVARVRGDFGWREIEWDNGAVHRYEWQHVLLDLRCKICLRPQMAKIFMVTDELWEISGLDGAAKIVLDIPDEHASNDSEARQYALAVLNEALIPDDNAEVTDVALDSSVEPDESGAPAIEAAGTADEPSIIDVEEVPLGNSDEDNK